MPAFKWLNNFPINVDLATPTLVLMAFLCIVAAATVPMRFGQVRQESLRKWSFVKLEISFVVLSVLFED